MAFPAPVAPSAPPVSAVPPASRPDYGRRAMHIANDAACHAMAAADRAATNAVAAAAAP